MEFHEARQLKEGDTVLFWIHGKHFRDSRIYEVKGKITNAYEHEVFKAMEFKIYCSDETRKAVALERKFATRVSHNQIIEKI